MQIIQSAGIEECRLQTVAAARHQPACCPGGRAGAGRGGPGGHSFWGKLLVLTDTGWRGTRDTCAGHVTPSLLTVLGSHVSSMQARSPGERSQPRVIAVWAGYRLCRCARLLQSVFTTGSPQLLAAPARVTRAPHGACAGPGPASSIGPYRQISVAIICTWDREAAALIMLRGGGQ